MYPNSPYKPDAGVTSLSFRTRVGATELLKQSRGLLFSRPGFGKLASADTEVYSF